MKKWSLRNRNQGASLLAVLIVLIFVSVIALILTRVTITNIEMKEVERGDRKNFYSAEAIMDELTVGLNEVASKAMEQAYADVLVNYSDYMKSGKNLQKQFQGKYMEQLEDSLWDHSTAQQTRTEALEPTTLLYTVSNYSVDTLRNCIKTAANRGYLVTSSADASYTLDYVEGIFTLKNVKIAYQDAQSYETVITTDIVFHTPIMSFTGNRCTAAYMKYSLIADRMLEIGAANVSIAGNVYAGADGIESVNGGYGSLTGNAIITRGDILTNSGTSLSIGNSAGTSGIWAENVRTAGKGTPSTLSLTGNCYVADDLALEGKDSTVKLTGNYYGYNFQKNYDVTAEEKDAAFSSAMLINAQGCKLDMESLNYLMLSGHTFISRGSKGNTQNSDIMMGESVSVRTNQLAYYVPAACLNDEKTEFTESGVKKYEQSTGVENITDYLDSARQVTPYYFVDSVSHIAQVNYYLNFASEQKANKFFSAYYNVNGNKLNSYASLYASNDAIVLDTNRIYTLKGDVMYRDAAEGELKALPVSIDVTDWNAGGAYWDYSSKLAVKYKSLQLGLTEARTGVEASNVRITAADGTVDKTVTPLFSELINKQALKQSVNAVSGGVSVVVDNVISGTPKHQVVVLVDNEASSSYQIPVEYTEGIIIATGDVYVAGSFKGMILSGGKINFAANASVSADEGLVSDLFAEDMELVTPKFVTYFNEQGAVSNAAIGSIEIKNYLSYENWKKN